MEIFASTKGASLILFSIATLYFLPATAADSMSINTFSAGGVEPYCTGNQITYTLFEGACLQFDRTFEPKAFWPITVNVSTVPSCSPFSLILFIGNSCNYTLNEWYPLDLNAYCAFTWDTGSESPIGVCKACNRTGAPGPDNWLQLESIGFLCSGNQDSFHTTYSELASSSLTQTMRTPTVASSSASSLSSDRSLSVSTKSESQSQSTTTSSPSSACAASSNSSSCAPQVNPVVAAYVIPSVFGGGTIFIMLILWFWKPEELKACLRKCVACRKAL